jgi:hypothetical protein
MGVRGVGEAELEKCAKKGGRESEASLQIVIETIT